jgi:hypothetical protein
MSFLRFKNGVIIPKSAIIAAAAHNARTQLGLPGDTWVTSANDSVHMRGSRHYTDEALDLRIHGLTKIQVAEWAAAIKTRLGLKYDVVVEKDHIHVEYDPKSAS